MPGSAMYYLTDIQRKCNSQGKRSGITQDNIYIKITENINENAFYN
jgi:hypothetical protein